MTSRNDRNRHLVNGDLVQGGIQSTIALRFVVILNDNAVSGTLIFDDVKRPKNLGNVFPDNDVLLLFDDENVDFERLSRELMLRFKRQNVQIIFKFLLNGLHKGRMPCDTSHEEMIWLFSSRTRRKRPARR